MIKRIKKLVNLWKLSKKIEADILVEEKKDGVFLPEMTEAEMNAWLRDNEAGWGKFYDKLKEILK